MGRRAATALHLALILIGAVAYIVFVLPRWWVFIGAVPPTLATVGRIAAALPIGAAAVPVWLTLQRSLTPDAQTPELALRLRAWSAVLHVVAAVLILLAAVTEIWLSLQAAGPWLFGVYGAAGAVVILAVTAFYLSFVAEQPPAPPKAAAVPKEPKEKPRIRKRRSAATSTPEAADAADIPQAATDEGEAPEVEAADAGDSAAESVDEAEPSSVETSDTTTEIPAAPAAATTGLRNTRPAGKVRRRPGR